MIFVQTCWSCKQPTLTNFNAGWYAPEYHLMSLALSCLLLKKQHQYVDLYADRVATETLINKIDLPYDRVFCDLDKLNDYDSQLWALPKIYTYSKQKDPFLHVDNDVFIWEPFKNELLSNKIIVQNKEIASEHYNNVFKALEANLTYFPSEILNERISNNQIFAYNAGIIGGTDIDFFQEYTRKSLKFINCNRNNFYKISTTNFNIIFEQYLLYCLAKNKKKHVSVLINDLITDVDYCGFGDFDSIPYEKRYLHLIGTYKRNKIICEQLADRLRFEYPDYYYRIISLFKKGNNSLKKDFYYHIKDTGEQFLSNRYKILYNQKLDFSINEKYKTKQKFNKALLSEKLKLFLFETFATKTLSDLSEEIKVFFKDCLFFEKKLDKKIEKVFGDTSLDQLYSRDIRIANYCQLIFEKGKDLNQLIVFDNLVQIVKSRYNWGAIDVTSESYLDLATLLHSKTLTCYTAIIPECDQHGYTLINIDELDCLLIRQLKKPKTLQKLLSNIKFAFDLREVETSLNDFTKLISGRIKIGIMNKIFTVVVLKS